MPSGSEPVAGQGEALETRAIAHYLSSDYPAAIEAFEQAHRSFRESGEVIGAARAARMLAWVHGNVIGDWAVQQGWTSRARSALADADAGSPEQGWLLLLEALDEPDNGIKLAGLREAVQIGRATGDTDLEFEALGWHGLTLVFGGHVASGMALLDESLTAVCAGEVTDLTVIEGTFCGMLWACEVVQDVGRAEQWIRVSDDFCRRRNIPTMTSFCRAHYGAILAAAGRWHEAETELTRAVELAIRIDTRLRWNALVRLAGLRVHQGRLEEAAQLLAGLDRFPEAARALASLHLARGDPALARTVLERVLEPDIEVASDVSLLALLVEVAVMDGDRPTAAAAAGRLEALASAQPDPVLRAHAALARGRILVGGDRSADAVGFLDRAVTEFGGTGMPMELAVARFELARALGPDRPDLAVSEARAALEAFETLGAARSADATAELLRTLGAPARTGRRGADGLTRRESEVLTLLGHGLTNPEISDRLFISRKTVEHHVSSILAKLGLRSRAEAAGFAARQTSAAK